MSEQKIEKLLRGRNLEKLSVEAEKSLGEWEKLLAEFAKLDKLKRLGVLGRINEAKEKLEILKQKLQTQEVDELTEALGDMTMAMREIEKEIDLVKQNILVNDEVERLKADQNNSRYASRTRRVEDLSFPEEGDAVRSKERRRELKRGNLINYKGEEYEVVEVSREDDGIIIQSLLNPKVKFFVSNENFVQHGKFIAPVVAENDRSDARKRRKTKGDRDLRVERRTVENRKNNPQIPNNEAGYNLEDISPVVQEERDVGMPPVSRAPVEDYEAGLKRQREEELKIIANLKKGDTKVIGGVTYFVDPITDEVMMRLKNGQVMSAHAGDDEREYRSLPKSSKERSDSGEVIVSLESVNNFEDLFHFIRTILGREKISIGGRQTYENMKGAEEIISVIKDLIDKYITKKHKGTKHEFYNDLSYVTRGQGTVLDGLRDKVKKLILPEISLVSGYLPNQIVYFEVPGGYSEVVVVEDVGSDQVKCKVFEKGEEVIKFLPREKLSSYLKNKDSVVYPIYNEEMSVEDREGVEFSVSKDGLSETVRQLIAELSFEEKAQLAGIEDKDIKDLISQAKYIGSQKNNLPDGFGQLHFANGVVFYGLWKDGKLEKYIGMKMAGETPEMSEDRKLFWSKEDKSSELPLEDATDISSDFREFLWDEFSTHDEEGNLVYSPELVALFEASDGKDKFLQMISSEPRFTPLRDKNIPPLYDQQYTWQDLVGLWYDGNRQRYFKGSARIEKVKPDTDWLEKYSQEKMPELADLLVYVDGTNYSVDLRKNLLRAINTLENKDGYSLEYIRGLVTKRTEMIRKMVDMVESDSEHHELMEMYKKYNGTEFPGLLDSTIQFFLPLDRDLSVSSDPRHILSSRKEFMKKNLRLKILAELKRPDGEVRDIYDLEYLLEKTSDLAVEGIDFWLALEAEKNPSRIDMLLRRGEKLKQKTEQHKVEYKRLLENLIQDIKNQLSMVAAAEYVPGEPLEPKKTLLEYISLDEALSDAARFFTLDEFEKVKDRVRGMLVDDIQSEISDEDVKNIFARGKKRIDALIAERLPKETNPPEEETTPAGEGATGESETRAGNEQMDRFIRNLKAVGYENAGEQVTALVERWRQAGHSDRAIEDYFQKLNEAMTGSMKQVINPELQKFTAWLEGVKGQSEEDKQTFFADIQKRILKFVGAIVWQEFSGRGFGSLTTESVIQSVRRQVTEEIGQIYELNVQVPGVSFKEYTGRLFQAGGDTLAETADENGERETEAEVIVEDRKEKIHVLDLRRFGDFEIFIGQTLRLKSGGTALVENVSNDNQGKFLSLIIGNGERMVVFDDEISDKIMIDETMMLANFVATDTRREELWEKQLSVIRNKFLSSFKIGKDGMRKSDQDAWFIYQDALKQYFEFHQDKYGKDFQKFLAKEAEILYTTLPRESVDSLWKELSGGFSASIQAMKNKIANEKKRAQAMAESVGKNNRQTGVSRSESTATSRSEEPRALRILPSGGVSTASSGAGSVIVGGGGGGANVEERRTAARSPGRQERVEMKKEFSFAGEKYTTGQEISVSFPGEDDMKKITILGVTDNGKIRFVNNGKVVRMSEIEWTGVMMKTRFMKDALAGEAEMEAQAQAVSQGLEVTPSSSTIFGNKNKLRRKALDERGIPEENIKDLMTFRLEHLFDESSELVEVIVEKMKKADKIDNAFIKSLTPDERFVWDFANNRDWNGRVLDGKSCFASTKGEHSHLVVLYMDKGHRILVRHDKPLKISGGTLVEVDESGDNIPVKPVMIEDKVVFESVQIK